MPSEKVFSQTKIMTIIIPTLNAGKQIGRLLASLMSQTVRCKILIVDSSDSGAVTGIAASFGAEMMSVPREKFDHGGTRDLAARTATGSILIFLSQDVLPYDKYAIENLLRPFEDQDMGAVYGRQLPGPGATPFAAHLRLFNYPECSSVKGISEKGKYGIKTPFLSNAFSAYRKEALMRIGGFRKKLIVGEDTCAGAQLLLAGYKLGYAADAAVYHSHNYTLLQEFGRYFDIGVFHKTENWILDEFGKAEGEGRRYINSELNFLVGLGKYHLIPESLLRMFAKYAGYLLGRNYGKIPNAVIRKISMHPEWWRA